MDTITVDNLMDFLQYEYTLTKWCSHCKEFRGDVDIEGLVSTGHGHLAPRELNLKCGVCHCYVSLTVCPPKRYAQTSG